MLLPPATSDDQTRTLLDFEGIGYVIALENSSGRRKFYITDETPDMDVLARVAGGQDIILVRNMGTGGFEPMKGDRYGIRPT